MQEIEVLFKKIDMITADLHEIKVEMAKRNKQESEIQENRQLLQQHALHIARLKSQVMILSTILVALVIKIAAGLLPG